MTTYSKEELTYRAGTEQGRERAMRNARHVYARAYDEAVATLDPEWRAVAGTCHWELALQVEAYEAYVEYPRSLVVMRLHHSTHAQGRGHTDIGMRVDGSVNILQLANILDDYARTWEKDRQAELQKEANLAARDAVSHVWFGLALPTGRPDRYEFKARSEQMDVRVSDVTLWQALRLDRLAHKMFSVSSD